MADLSSSIERNATTSPLLRLPPEIRNRIFHFVLGGEHIHVFRDYQRQGTTNGRRPRSLDKRGYWCLYNTTAGIGASDEDKWKHFYSIKLLLVCRQIYAEACLLPYALNIFSAYNATVLRSAFLPSLKPCQRRALRSLAIKWSWKPAVRVANSMDGVKEVYVWFGDVDEGPWLGFPSKKNRLVIPIHIEDLDGLDSCDRLQQRKEAKLAGAKWRATDVQGWYNFHDNPSSYVYWAYA